MRFLFKMPVLARLALQSLYIFVFPKVRDYPLKVLRPEIQTTIEMKSFKDLLRLVMYLYLPQGERILSRSITSGDPEFCTRMEIESFKDLLRFIKSHVFDVA